MVKRSNRNIQIEFDGSEFIKPGDEFGGSLLKGNAKSKRPLATKLPIHLTLRAEKSVLRLPKTMAAVHRIITLSAQKYGVTIYKQANAGNHLHIVIKLSSLRLWAPFIRELTGRLAHDVMLLLGVTNLNFWKFKPHTRIVRGWKKAFRSVMRYVELNQWEAEGFMSRKDAHLLKGLGAIWADG